MKKAAVRFSKLAPREKYRWETGGVFDDRASGVKLDKALYNFIEKNEMYATRGRG